MARSAARGVPFVEEVTLGLTVTPSPPHPGREAVLAALATLPSVTLVVAGQGARNAEIWVSTRSLVRLIQDLSSTPALADARVSWTPDSGLLVAFPAATDSMTTAPVAGRPADEAHPAPLAPEVGYLEWRPDLGWALTTGDAGDATGSRTQFVGDPGDDRAEPADEQVRLAELLWVAGEGWVLQSDADLGPVAEAERLSPARVAGVVAGDPAPPEVALGDAGVAPSQPAARTDAEDDGPQVYPHGAGAAVAHPERRPDEARDGTSPGFRAPSSVVLAGRLLSTLRRGYRRARVRIAGLTRGRSHGAAPLPAVRITSVRRAAVRAPRPSRRVLPDLAGVWRRRHVRAAALAAGGALLGVAAVWIAVALLPTGGGAGDDSRAGRAAEPVQPPAAVAAQPLPPPPAPPPAPRVTTVARQMTPGCVVLPARTPCDAEKRARWTGDLFAWQAHALHTGRPLPDEAGAARDAMLWRLEAGDPTVRIDLARTLGLPAPVLTEAAFIVRPGATEQEVTVELANLGAAPADLSGIRLAADDGATLLTLPTGAALAPGARCRLSTGPAVENACAFSPAVAGRLPGAAPAALRLLGGAGEPIDLFPAER